LLEDREDRGGPFESSPTGPWVTPPRTATTHPPPAPPRAAARSRRRPIWSIIFFALLISSVGIRAYRDLSRPEAWAYWKESYLSPSMTSSVIATVNLDGADRAGPALAIQGAIGAASAGWLRQRIDDAHLTAGDLVLLSSPGGNLDQALVMGEIIRSRGLATAVGTADASGRITRSYCASACVLVYAGGTPRYGIEGSVLGVHRFTNAQPGRDPVADAQRITGMVLSYMTKMGVSSTVVEAMSATREIRWLSPTEALAMNLITKPVGTAEAARH
jgi:membrane-bound ClpP family serine protease